MAGRGWRWSLMPARRSSPTPASSSSGRAWRQGCPSRCCRARAPPLTALVASGLPSAQWRFAGFLPRRRGELAGLLAAAPETLVAFESPRRLAATLAVLAELDPQRPVAVCRELTKLHEEVARGSAAELAARFAAAPARGEIVLVLRCRRSRRGRRVEEALEALRELVAAGARARPAAAVVAAAHRARGQRALPGADALRRVAWAARDVLLRHDPDLLRQRGAAPRPRLHDDRGRCDGAPPPPAGRGGVLPDRAPTSTASPSPTPRTRSASSPRSSRTATRSASRRSRRSSARATTSSSARPTREHEAVVQRGALAGARQRLRLRGHLRGLVLPALRRLQGRQRDRRGQPLPDPPHRADARAGGQLLLQAVRLPGAARAPVRGAPGFRRAPHALTTRRSRSSAPGCATCR